MKIIAKIPAVKTFDLPTGRFKATLSQIKPLTKQTKKGPQNWIRLVFEVQVNSMADQIPCAGRNFQLDLSPGSDLRNFLEVWLGTEFFTSKSNQDLDFSELIGKDGDICLSHYLGDDYEKPLVIVDNVFPNSSLRLEEKPKSIAPVLKK
jgi:hypothetical protein